MEFAAARAAHRPVISCSQFCCLSTKILHKKIIRFASRAPYRDTGPSRIVTPPGDAARAPGRSVARRPQTRVQRQLEKLSHTFQPLRHRPAVHTPPSSRAQTSNPTRCRTSRTLERTLKQILGFRRYQGHAIIAQWKSARPAQGPTHAHLSRGVPPSGSAPHLLLKHLQSKPSVDPPTLLGRRATKGMAPFHQYPSNALRRHLAVHRGSPRPYTRRQIR